MTRERQAAYWIVGLIAFLLAVYLLSAILLPFVLGLAIAYFADPAADKLEDWGLPRWAAATILTVLMFLAVAAFILLFVPLLQSQVINFLSRLPEYTEALRRQADQLLALVQASLSPEDVERLRGMAGEFAGNTLSWLGKLLGRVWSGGVAVLNLLSLILITPIVTFYMLRDWDRFVARLDKLLPPQHAPTIREQAGEIDKTLAGFVRGQALVCMLLGAFYGIALTVAGLDFGLIIGLIAGLISFVPYFGMLVGLVLSVGLALAQFDDWVRIAIIAAIFLVGQVIEGNVVTPKLVGDRVGLHPVWMIFALLAGGALFGFVGVLISVPVAAVIGVLIRFAVTRYLESPLYGTPAATSSDEEAQK